MTSGQDSFPPVSLVLATWADDYVTALTGLRYQGPADGGRSATG
jgi:hypothetical protein